MGGTSKRRQGVEWKVMAWLARHPGFVAVPSLAVAGVAELGPTTTAGITAGLAGGLLAWYRGHPDSFDTWAAPRLRAVRRRWLSRTYLGPWWRDAMLACGLYTENRRTGELRIPRVIRVRAYTPTIDTVWVRLVPGQHVRQWEQVLPELAETLRAERVGVERVRPQVIALVVQRAESFTEVIDAPEMPWDADAVDLGAVYLGETEYGDDWCEAVLGQHWLVAGATGSGKNSLTWTPLRGLAPWIRDGLCRVWMCDPKQTELAPGRGLAYRYAAEEDECAELIAEFVADQQATQQHLAAQGLRKFTPSPETPLNVLVLDELGALLAYGNASTARETRRHLALVGSQGRATGHHMWGYVQEPSKDVVPVRDLFTLRVCLRVTSAAHVDMVLGDGARLRGALADEIPNTPETAGIGYVIRQRSRTPLRVRAAYTSDAQIAELTAFVQGDGRTLRVVA